ncbi:MAG: AAA family ATPase [bacterium]
MEDIDLGGNQEDLQGSPQAERGDGGVAARQIESRVEQEQAAQAAAIEQPAELQDAAPDPTWALVYDTEDGLTHDPKYLEMLREKCFQSFANRELDEKGRIEKRGVAIIRIDIAYSTIELNEKFQRFLESQTNRPDKSAIEEIAQHSYLPIHDEIMAVFRQCGIKGDKFLGDGARGLCEGGVEQAVYAADILRRNLSKYNIRIGIDVGDVSLIGYGDSQEKKALMVGAAVDGAEVAQKYAGAGGIGLSELAFLKLSKSETLEVGFSGIHDGAYRIAEVNLVEGATVPGWDAHQNKPRSVEDVAAEVRAIERFISPARRRDLRFEYLKGAKSDMGGYEVCTLVVQLPKINERGFAEANQIISDMFDIISRSGGDVDKMDGETIMANFVASSSDRDGVRAGLRMVDKLRELGVEFSMSAARSNAIAIVMGGERTVLGRGVVLAHRGAQEDNPGNVLLVDESLMRRVGTQVCEFEELSPKLYKNEAEPRHRFVINEMKGRYELLRADELVGRDKELASLHRGYEVAKRRGGGGQLIVGRQGFGKSALVAEFWAQKKREGSGAFFGRAEKFTRKQAFAVWRDLFDNMLDMEGMSADERTKMVSAGYPELVEALAILNPVLGTRFEKTPMVTALEKDPQDIAEKRAELIGKIFKRMAGEEQIVALLEDAQFFDDDSTALTKDVLQQIQDSGAYMIVTTRPTEAGGDGDPASYEELTKVVGIETTELNTALPIFTGDPRNREEIDTWWQQTKELWWKAANACVRLDRQDFRDDEDVRLFRRIFWDLSRTTSGSFLAFESCMKRWTLYEPERGYFKAEQKLHDGSMTPETVYMLVRKNSGEAPWIADEDFDARDISGIEAKRFKEQPAPLRMRLADGTVVGSDFSIDELMCLDRDADPAQIREELQVAVKSGFIRSMGGDRYAVINPDVGEAIYRTIADHEVRFKHRLMAQYIRKTDSDNLSLRVHHSRHSDDYVGTLLIINDYARQLDRDFLWGGVLSQVDYASRALAQLRGQQWKSIDSPSKAEDAPQRELDDKVLEKVVHDHIDNLLLAARLLRAKMLHYDRANEKINDATSLFVEFHGVDMSAMSPNDLITLSNLYIENAQIKWPQGDKAGNETAINRASSALELMEAEMQKPTTVRANGETVLGRQYREARFRLHQAIGLRLVLLDKRRESIDQHLEALKWASSPSEEMAVYYDIASRYQKLGELDRARIELEKALKIARENGEVGDLPSILVKLGEISLMNGDVAGADRYYQEARVGAEKVGRTSAVITIEITEGFRERDKGNYQLALEIFSRTRAKAEKRGDLSNVAMVTAEMVFCTMKLLSSGSQDVTRGAMWRWINLLKNCSFDKFSARGYTLEAIARASGFSPDDKAQTQLNWPELKKVFETGLAGLEKQDEPWDLFEFAKATVRAGGSREEARHYAEMAIQASEESGETGLLGDIHTFLESLK